MPILYDVLRFLGLTDGGQASRQRVPRGPRPPLLTWLGLAERRVTVAGHPRIRERAVQRFARRRRRSQMVTGSVGLLLVLGLSVWGLLRSPLLAVEAVRVVGVTTPRGAEVLDLATVRPGQNVLDVDLDGVRREVHGLPWVQEVTVRRRLPSTVEIRVATRRPVLSGVFGDTTYAIDGDGVVLGEGGTNDLPTITLPVAPAIGSRLEASVMRAFADVARQMPAGMNEWIVGYSAQSADEVEAHLQVPTLNGPVAVTVLMGRPVAIPVKAATIASLVEETVGRGQTPRALDVRIPDRPVVLA